MPFISVAPKVTRIGEVPTSLPLVPGGGLPPGAGLGTHGVWLALQSRKRRPQRRQEVRLRRRRPTRKVRPACREGLRGFVTVPRGTAGAPKGTPVDVGRPPGARPAACAPAPPARAGP